MLASHRASSCSSSSAPSCSGRDAGGSIGRRVMHVGGSFGRPCSAAARTRASQPAAATLQLLGTRSVVFKRISSSQGGVAARAAAADSSIASPPQSAAESEGANDSGQQVQQQDPMAMLEQEYEGGMSHDEQARLLRDLSVFESSSRAAAPGIVDVTAERYVTDAKELQAVGSGLPIVDGVRNGLMWPCQLA